MSHTAAPTIAPPSAPTNDAPSAYPTDEQILGINNGDESAFDALLAGAAANARRIIEARANGSEPVARVPRTRGLPLNSNFAQDFTNSGESARNATVNSRGDAGSAAASVTIPAFGERGLHDGANESAADENPSARAASEITALPARLPNDAPEWLARASAAAPDSAPQLAAMYQRANALETFDRAYYGADAAAQQSLVAQLYADDPAALRAMVAAAQQFIAGGASAPRQEPRGSMDNSLDAHSDSSSAHPNFTTSPEAPASGRTEFSRTGADRAPSHTNNFDPAAYAQFEQSTNDAVVADVNRAIERALDRALPANISDGARRRIAGDTLAEVHAALRGDRDLSAQVAQMLRGAIASSAQFGGAFGAPHSNFTTSPEAPASGRTEFSRTGGAPRQEPGGSMAFSGSARAGASSTHSQLSASRFDSATRDAVARLIATRARTVVPEAARRVIGEWTGSVLASHRDRAAKTQAASARVDVTGGGMNSPTPRRAVSPRDINYRATSDEDILSW